MTDVTLTDDEREALSRALNDDWWGASGDRHLVAAVERIVAARLRVQADGQSE